MSRYRPARPSSTRARAETSSRASLPLLAQQPADDERKHQHRGGAGQLYHAPHEQTVFAGHGIVTVAVQQDAIDRRSDLAVRRFDQRETQIFRRILDAVKIMG